MKMRDKPVGWLGSKGWGNPIESEWTQGMTCSKTFTSLESTMFYISLTSRWTSSLTIWTLKFWSYFHLTIMSSNLQTSTHRTKMCILLSLQIVSHVKHHTMFVFVTLHKKTYSLTIIFHPKNSLTCFHSPCFQISLRLPKSHVLLHSYQLLPACPFFPTCYWVFNTVILLLSFISSSYSFFFFP